MTLHQTVIYAKKGILAIALGSVAFIILILLYRLGIVIKNVLFPPKIQAENHIYGTLPLLEFPQNVTTQDFKYTLNTNTGGLPDFPDRLNIFPIIQPKPDLLNLNKARIKASALGFIDGNAHVLPEKAINNSNYEWDEPEGIRKKLVMNTISFNFLLRSNFTTSLTVIAAANLGDQKIAQGAAIQYIDSISLLPDDLDKGKTKTELFSIQNSKLIPATSLSNTQVIRVDLYQKDLEYDLDTGIPEVTGGYKIEKMDLPILYSNPPHSTMNFLVGAGNVGQQVIEANFIHQRIDRSTNNNATYRIKTAQEDLADLKNGKGYIAAYFGSDADISILKVYLAYYLGETPQTFLMPIVVFEGEDGFVAYVSAVRDEWTK